MIRGTPRVLVDAAIRLLSEEPALRLRLIGADRPAGEVPGGMREFLIGRIPVGLRDRVLFDGSLPRGAILAACVASRVCVFPAPWDSFPYACAGAMAAGACVVATSAGGLLEMIEHGVSGRELRFVGQVTRSDRIHQPVAELPLALVGVPLPREAGTQTDAFGEFVLSSARDGIYGLRLGDAGDSPCVMVWEGWD